MSFSDICTGCGRPVVMLRREANMQLIHEVAEKYGVLVSDIMSSSRFQHHVYARQEVYYLLSKSGMSSAQIGRMLDRDHTSVLHGIRVFKARKNRMGANLLQHRSKDQEYDLQQCWHTLHHAYSWPISRIAEECDRKPLAIERGIEIHNKRLTDLARRSAA